MRTQFSREGGSSPGTSTITIELCLFRWKSTCCLYGIVASKSEAHESSNCRSQNTNVVMIQVPVQPRPPPDSRNPFLPIIFLQSPSRSASIELLSRYSLLNAEEQTKPKAVQDSTLGLVPIANSCSQLKQFHPQKKCPALVPLGIKTRVPR
jgi:hypothetical protein